jgi:hypothetical protein
MLSPTAASARISVGTMIEFRKYSLAAKGIRRKAAATIASTATRSWAIGKIAMSAL